MILGIDLGTTHSLVGYFENGQPRLIKNANGQVLTPSVVSEDEDGTLLIGESARHRLITHPEVTFSEFKRFMGTEKKYSLKIGSALDATDLSAMVLKSLKADAERELKQIIGKAVISVPAYFNNRQREATKQAARLAGFQQIGLVNEPTAAALMFGVNENQDEEAYYLILDLGGGTFDVSLLEVFNGIYEIHASAGDNYLGGKDFTEAIVKHIAEKHTLDIKELTGKEKEKLYKAAETIKCDLSKNLTSKTTIRLEAKEIVYELDSPGFSEICEPLLRKLIPPISRVMSDAKHSPSELTGVILVGGATRMPPFRNMVSRMLKQIPRRDYQPDEAIALGCALQAALVAREASVEDIVMTDVCPYTLGVAVHGWNNGSEFLPIIERNTSIPVSETRPLQLRNPDQRKGAVMIYQGESINPADNLYLGNLDIELPEGYENNSFLLTYTYDLDGTLEVEVSVPDTDVKFKTHIKNGEAYFDDHLERRFERLAHLKVLPHEQQRNREMQSRLERLFEENIGEDREYIANLLRHFNHALNTYNTKKIEQAFEQIEEALNQFNEYRL